jgi:hypothetical protein
MSDPPGAAAAFPPRAIDSIRVDSEAEEHAYIAAWPPASGGAWSIRGWAFVPGIPSTQKRVVITTPEGAPSVVHFLVGSYHGGRPKPVPTPGERVSTAMRAGHELAKEEGPLHPGTMPQYPVPSATHAGAVAVPLPVLAIDAGQRWLYAPPRIAVVRWSSTEAVGVGDAAGFDPDDWPPARLGEWPPAAVRAWDQSRLAGAIDRFTAIWSRLLDVWFGGDRYPQLDDERLEALLLLALLLPAPMLDIYADLNPDFWAWLREDQRQDAN